MQKIRFISPQKKDSKYNLDKNFIDLMKFSIMVRFCLNSVNLYNGKYSPFS